MTFIIPLSKFWWIVIILIFGAWVFFTRLLFREKGGSSGGGLAGALVSGTGGYLTGKLAGTIQERDKELGKLIKSRLDIMEGIVGKMHGLDPVEKGKLSEDFMHASNQARDDIKEFIGFGKMAGVKVERKRGDEYEKRYEKIMKKFKDAS